MRSGSSTQPSAAPARAGRDPWSGPIAAAAVGLWALNLPLAMGLRTSLVVVLLCLPMWLPSVTDQRWTRRLTILTGLAAANGIFLLAFLSRSFSTTVAVSQGLFLVGILGGVGLLAWGHQHVSTQVLVIILGVGFLAGAVSNLGEAANDWKYVWSAPLTLILLGAVQRTGLVGQAIVLVLLGAVGAANDSRSYLGFCLLTLGLLIVGRRREASSTRWGSRVGVLAATAALFVGLYAAGTSFLLGGFLGEETAQRTERQVERAGSLLAGGRPEWSGTIELMQLQPSGFGWGATPEYRDVWAAREGLDQVGIGPDNGYVDTYMFGGEFKLHSVLADLWAQCGWLGLVLGLAMGLVIVLGLINGLMTGRLAAAVIFLGVKGLWDLGFSPIYSGLPWVVAAVALLAPLVPRMRGSSSDVVQPRGDPAAR